MGTDELIVGIDLGTTNSCIACVLDGTVHVIPDEENAVLQASVVTFLDDDSVIVGNHARGRITTSPERTIYSAKRLIGRSYKSAAIQQAVKQLPYRVTKGEGAQPFVQVGREKYALPEISGMVVRRMKDIASAYLKRAITSAVITVPANFNDTQRQMTKLAAELAGLKVVRVINEPTAAALAYGYGHDVNARIAIFDLGGGTFDITILDVRGNIFEVLATAGDGHLGGDDFDLRLAKSMAAAFEQQHQVSLADNPLAQARLLHVAEQTKLELTASDTAIVNVQALTQNANGQPCDLKFRLNRGTFAAHCQDIIQRAFVVCDEALNAARLKASDLDQIIRVGGSTRIPLVREMVAEYFQSTPLTDINPDEVVAVGAAIQGAALAVDHFAPDADNEQPLLLDVAPRSLGLGTVDDYYEVLIERNAQVPCERKQVFTTTHDDQTAVRIRIYQGESPSTVENTSLGEIELYGLTPAPRGHVKIEVSFEIDVNGIVIVKATDLATGLEQATRISISAGYANDEIHTMRERGVV